jgi:transcriptional regulator
MYPPPIYLASPDEAQSMLRAVGLGALVTHGADGFAVTHMPFVYDENEGALVGHVSRRNPHALGLASEGVVIFSGPDAYVTPSLYPSKALHGRVAPTWNYVALHVHGRLEWIDDPVWLRGNLGRLTDRFEAGREEPWKVDDAPEDFTAQLIPRIVGLRLRPDRVEARRKLSQEKKEPDRLGVLAGLSASEDLASRAVASAMADLAARDA